MLIALATLCMINVTKRPARCEEAQPTGAARAVCFQVSEVGIPVEVPQSNMFWKSRVVKVTQTISIAPDGRIHVSLSNVKHDQQIPSLKWLFPNAQITAHISDLEVDQTATPTGDIQHTYVSFRLHLRLVGEANVVTGVEFVPGYSAAVYGPAVEASGELNYKVSFRSNTWPLLNSVSKDQFRPGMMEGVAFQGLSLKGGEFPNRTFLENKEGMVLIKRAHGNWTKAETQMDLEVGDWVRTLSNGKATIILAGTAVIRLKPESEFVIPEDTANSTEKVSFIRMIQGVLWANAKKRDDSLSVATPSAICGLRGTEFEIQVDDQQSCFYCVTGELLVKPTSAARDFTELVVKAGERKCVLSEPADAKTSSIPVSVRVTEKRRGQEQPVAGALVTLRQEGVKLPVSEAFTDGQGFARLVAEKVDVYEIEATADELYISKKIANAAVTTGRSTRFDILLQRRGETPADDASEKPVTYCNFAGTWKVLWYNNVEGTGQPTGEQKLMIVVQDGKATGYSDMWAEKVEEFCSGPLSQNGQVWNANRYVNGELQLRFYDIHFDPDCDRFVGKWSGNMPEGYEPHNYAWIGTRTSDTASHTDAAKQTVELSNRNRAQTLNVAPGAQITVKVATYAGTGYQMEMAPLATRDLTVSGPSDEPMGRPRGTGSGPLVGAGTWAVYRVTVAPEATGEQVLKFNFFRTRGKVDIVYVLTFQIQE